MKSFHTTIWAGKPGDMWHYETSTNRAQDIDVLRRWLQQTLKHKSAKTPFWIIARDCTGGSPVPPKQQEASQLTFFPENRHDSQR